MSMEEYYRNYGINADERLKLKEGIIKEKDEHLQRLMFEISQLRKELQHKEDIIYQQANEIKRLNVRPRY